MKARGRGGKKATGGQRKRGPATTKYVAHTIDGHRAINCVLSPPHFEPTDLPPQENCPGPQLQRRPPFFFSLFHLILHTNVSDSAKCVLADSGISVVPPC